MIEQRVRFLSLEIYLQGFHLLGDFDRAESQVSVLRDLFVRFPLLGDLDRAEGQVSVLRDLFVRFPPARRF